jgi:hypothetical protein
MKQFGLMLGILGASMVCGCSFHSANQPATTTDLRAEVHRMVKEELLSVREDYVSARPDLTEEERRAVLNGDRQMSSVESDRKRREQERAATAEKHEEPGAVDTQMAEARSNYFELNPSVTPEVKQAIQDNKLVIGMTAEEVKLSWREPKKVVETIGDAGTLELWDYGNNHFLTFADGRLKFWNKAVGH